MIHNECPLPKLLGSQTAKFSSLLLYSNRVMTVTLYLFQLRVSRPSGEYLTLAEGLCDPTNEMVFELSVSYTAVQLSVALSGGAPANYPPPPSLTQFGELVLTIGNLPGK